MVPYEVLYGKPCCSPSYWDEVGTRPYQGSDLVQVTIAKIYFIRRNLLTDKSQHKSYADNKMRDLEFNAGDNVFPKVYLIKGVLQFGRRRKLSLSFI